MKELHYLQKKKIGKDKPTKIMFSFGFLIFGIHEEFTLCNPLKKFFSAFPFFMEKNFYMLFVQKRGVFKAENAIAHV